MENVFTIENLRPIRYGMTVSRYSKLGTSNMATFFSMGKDTSISQESYDRMTMYIGAAGSGTFIIGNDKKKLTLTPDTAVIIPASTLCGMETSDGMVYTEVIFKKENSVIMNEIVKTNEVFALKNLISYEEGSIANKKDQHRRHRRGTDKNDDRLINPLSLASLASSPERGSSFASDGLHS